MKYVIRNEDDDQLFWSNELGWVSSPDETYFTEEERHTLNLPIGGIWSIANDD